MDKNRIIQLARSAQDHTITMDNLDTNFGNAYYCNSRFHLGNMMSRMVKNGQFIRLKKGVYKLNLISKDTNQKSLF